MAHSDQQLESRAHIQVEVALSFLVLTWVFVVGRFYVRSCMIKNLGWDDFTMVVANICFTLYCVALLVIAAHGGGTHVTNWDDVEYAINWVIISESMYGLTHIFLKLSLGLFMKRLATTRLQHRFIWGVIAVHTTIAIAYTFYVIFRCGSPNNYLVDQLAGKCTSRTVDLVFAYTSSASVTGADWMFTLLPILVLWNASMDKRTKIVVFFILSLGGFGSAFGCVRFVYLDGLTNYDDFFWSATNIAIWSAVEPGTGIIAGCLATMRPLFVKIFYHVKKATSAASERSASRKSRSRNATPNPSHPGESAYSRAMSLLKPWEKSSTTQTTATYVGGKDASIDMKEVTSQASSTSSPNKTGRNNRSQTQTGMLTTFGAASLYEWEQGGIMSSPINAEFSDRIEVDRRSSHTFGDEEAENVRRSLMPPPSENGTINHRDASDNV